ncbi:hypothetical protein ABTY61_34405 [Kitasatospora sp. NPDC096128]|uniref:hypothetical protein n=1 Tax=Kitasatospora sp. NPDC096128 TaxID=3155547 RepID=UPI003316505F
MRAEDEFEEELAVRLGTRAAGVAGSPPLAELREAGRRRARRRGVTRAVTAVAVLAVGAGVLIRLGGVGSSAEGPASAGTVVQPTVTPTPTGKARQTRGAETDERVKGVLSCRTGASSSAPTSPPQGQGAQRDLEEAGRAAEQLARRDYADHYFATCRDAAEDTLVVMRSPGPTGLDAAVTQAVAPWPDVKVRFVAAPAYPALLTLAREIRAEAGDWAATNHVLIASVEIAVDGTGVVVHTPQAEAARSELVKQYGNLVSVSL